MDVLVVAEVEQLQQDLLVDLFQLDQLVEQVQLQISQLLHLQNQQVEKEQDLQLPLQMEQLIVVMEVVDLIQVLLLMEDQELL